MDHTTQTRHIASSATTRRWCVYGIIAWGLASGLYLLLNGLALGLGNMINTPPTGPRSMPPVIMLRIALLAVPILPLMFWFVIAKRGNSHATHYGAMTVALLGIGMHFAWILLFAKLLAGG